MKKVKSKVRPDVVMIYQDRESVEPAIQQILELEIEFQAFKYNTNKLHAISGMNAKVLLLASNNVKSTIRLYINFLEEYEQNISPHSAVLLINNRETSRAYLACENGLFDDYVIINPLNEPDRLKLVLLHELQIIENHKNNSIEQLILEGEDELASCIEHGVTLKKNFTHEMKKVEKSISNAADNISVSDDAKVVLQKLLGLSLEEMNETISNGIQDIADQLEVLKSNNQLLKQGVEKQCSPKKKTLSGVNTELLTADDDNVKRKSSRYKILIAEPSDLFARVIDEIFSETVFIYALVNDGQTAIDKINEFKPDVVLLAYDLPTLNGIEVTRAIRGEDNKVPVVAYVHKKDRLVIREWIPFGISDYLMKPSKKSAILSSVTKAVNDPVLIIENDKGIGKDTIKWIPEYSVGHVEIDEQHKVLFTMINEFFHQSSKESAILLFQNLSSYIDLHFEAEENLLRQINYPETSDHIKKHNDLRDKFNLLEQKLDDYSIEIHQSIGVFLYNWLGKHILKEDMDYKSYALSIEVSSFRIE